MDQENLEQAVQPSGSDSVTRGYELLGQGARAIQEWRIRQQMELVRLGFDQNDEAAGNVLAEIGRELKDSIAFIGGLEESVRFVARQIGGIIASNPRLLSAFAAGIKKESLADDLGALVTLGQEKGGDVWGTVLGGMDIQQVEERSYESLPISEVRKLIREEVAGVLKAVIRPVPAKSGQKPVQAPQPFAAQPAQPALQQPQPDVNAAAASAAAMFAGQMATKAAEAPKTRDDMLQSALKAEEEPHLSEPKPAPKPAPEPEPVREPEPEPEPEPERKEAGPEEEIEI